MANLFSGLEHFGLGNLSEMKIFDKEKDAKAEAEKKKVEVKEEDFLFDKTFICKACDKEFKSKMVRTGKVKLLEQDTDLRPKYQHVDSLKYDAVVCPYCGFAALNRFFNYLTDSQAKLIKANISAKFKGLKEAGGALSYDEAMLRHKLVLINAIVKHAKSSEKAYICLKLAWLCRGKSETLPEDTKDLEAVKKVLAEQEKEYIANAYEGFNESFAKESFPICGMDENTLTYLCADLARQLGKYDDALRLVGRVITARGASDRIKSKGIEMKDRIKKEKEKLEKNSNQ